MANSRTPEILKKFEPHKVSGTAATPGLFQCLVVSGAQSRRDQLATAAVDGGWETVKFSDSRDATTYVKQRAIRLAIVDLEAADHAHASELRELVAQLAALKDVLLIVCGHQAQPREEVWARKLGIWLYLPGVVPDSDVGFLCGEARDLTARLTGMDRTAETRRIDSKETE